MFDVETEDADSADMLFDPNVSLMEELDISPEDIMKKVKTVLLPAASGGDRMVLLTEPDFWGPLLMMMIYASLIVWGQFKVISWILLLWLCGSFVVFFVARVLGR